MMKARSIGAARLLLPALAVSFLLGCRWQSRADDLQHSLNVFVEKGGRGKDDFIRRFGAPLSCRPISAGEICRWLSHPGELRVGFDKAGNYIGGTARVAHGGHVYRGKDEQVLDAAAAGAVACQNGTILQDGQCNPTPEMERPEDNSAQQDTTGATESARAHGNGE